MYSGKQTNFQASSHIVVQKKKKKKTPKKKYVQIAMQTQRMEYSYVSREGQQGYASLY